MKAILILLAFTLFCTFAVIVVLLLISKSKKQRYLQDIIFLENAVDNFIVNKNNYKTISYLFSDIFRNDQDKGRTYKAWEKFLIKYESYFPSKKKILSKVQSN